MALITKTYGKLLAILLSWLGFSAIYTSCAKYGCPCSEVQPKITGSVVSDQNNAPIQGIQAVLKDDYQGYDTAFTVQNGGFFLQYPYTICEEETNVLCVKLQDVDGDGAFEDVEIPVAVKSEINLGTIRMTPKE